MKKIFLIAGLLLSGIISFSQKVSNIDFDAIKKTVEGSPALYQQLLDRFLKADTTLTKEDYSLLYYGQCFQKSYNPYGSDVVNFEQFKKHYLAKEFSEAVVYALKMIDNNPMDMKMTFKALVCYHEMKDDAAKHKISTRYNNIMLSIFESGDGKSAPTAFVVMCVPDEYELMANLQVQNTSQSLVDSCDVMTLKENDLGLEKLYFNVSKPLGALSNMLKDK